MNKEENKGYLVRMSEKLHKQAQEDAERLGLSFSAYVRYLISREAENNKRAKEK